MFLSLPLPISRMGWKIYVYDRFFKAWTCRLAICSIPYFHFSFGIYSDQSTESTIGQTSSSVKYIDSDDSLSDEERVPELYQGNPNMPMYASGKTDNLSFDKVLDLLAEDHKLSELCRVQPMSVQRNASFLIDLTSVKLTELPCDDNGSYKGSGTHTWTYRLEDCNGRRQKTLVAKKRQDLRNDTSIVYLIRKYRTNISCSSFKQIISYAEDAKGNVINNIALVQYNFQGDEKSFEIGCHGNKKKDTSVPFLPTNQTTKERIKKFTRENKPKKAMAKLSKENNLLTANASASTVRDMTQIYNMRRQEKEKERQREGVPDEKACQSGTEPKFHRWIKQHSSMIKESMIKDKRVMAGLQPEEQITTNGAESANHVLKEAAEYEEMSLAEFVALSKSIAKNRQQEIIRAILRKGW